MFYEALLQTFVTFNKFLQREDPIILICVVLNHFFRKLLARLITKVGIIKAIEEVSEGDITSVGYVNSEMQLSGEL